MQEDAGGTASAVVSGDGFTTLQNLLLHTEALDQSIWSKQGYAVVLANQAAGPVGGSTADKVVLASGQTNTPNVRQNLAVTAGRDYNLSIHAKAAEQSVMSLIMGAITGTGIQVDLRTGTLVQTEAPAALQGYQIGDAGNAGGASPSPSARQSPGRRTTSRACAATTAASMPARGRTGSISGARR